MKVSIVFATILSSLNGLEIVCRFQDIGWMLGPLYSCQSDRTSNDANSKSIESLRGVHRIRRTNDDVECFNVFEEKTMTRLPNNIVNFFPNLVSIAWTSGSLAAISAEDLKPFPALRALDLGSNKISTLDGDLFTQTPNLVWIIFNTNFISSVGENLLANLNDLTNVFFENNVCIGSWADSYEGIQEIKHQLSTQCSTIEAAIEATT